MHKISKQEYPEKYNANLMTPYIITDGDQQPTVNTLEWFYIILIHYLY